MASRASLQEAERMRTDLTEEQLRAMSEEDRFSLLHTILSEEPPIRWKYLGRPGAALPGPAPMSSADWCQCGKCPEMATEPEKVCCGSNTRCITEDPEFLKATQDTFQLTLGVRYHRDRWAEAAPARDDLESPHRQCRYQAYRQFVLWQWGTMGRGNRRALPACAVAAIRRKYPSPSGRNLLLAAARRLASVERDVPYVAGGAESSSCYVAHCHHSLHMTPPTGDVEERGGA